MLGEEPADRIFSLEKETPVQQCPIFEWKKQINETSQDRFQTVFETNLFEFEKSNGIYA